MDPIDKMLQGEDTPSTLAGQNEGQQSDSSQVRPIEQQTEEEIEFNRLSGSTQDRIKELVRRAKDAENRFSTQQTYVPPAPNTVTSDQKQAIDTLRQFGISTKDDVKEEVNQGLNQIKWELKNQSLESKYSGSNGEPKYDREEVEDYIRSHPQYQYYDPEDVFRYKMFPDEFSGQQGQTTKPRTSSLKPTKSNPQVSPFSDMDQLERRLAQPDGDEYYEAHKDEINRAVAEHTNKFKGVNFGGQ